MIRLDFATYNPPSLVLKEKGRAEEAFGKEGIKVEWVQSQGSNRALSFLQGNNIDFGSTAGAAALISASNGYPIELIYIYSKPEWTALVAPRGSSIQKIVDLRGKKVAATLGTDPYIFLLRALNSVGFSEKDIELVPLQHGDGAAALANGQVDAWAGLDPHMARLELEEGVNLFYRNVEFNTYGVLNVRKEFSEKYPHYVQKVLELYERARTWARDNPDETATILARTAQIAPNVAKLQLSQRTNYPSPVPGNELKETLLAAGKVLKEGGHIVAQANIPSLVESLIQPRWAESLFIK